MNRLECDEHAGCVWLGRKHTWRTGACGIPACPAQSATYHVLHCGQTNEHGKVASKKRSDTHTSPARLCPNTLWLTDVWRPVVCSRGCSPHRRRPFQLFQTLGSIHPRTSGKIISTAIEDNKGGRNSQTSKFNQTQTTTGKMEISSPYDVARSAHFLYRYPVQTLSNRFVYA